ncbi:starch synthase [Clostridium cavendishii DSM 21758]|uniref:Glycogen synthase n=1 Tax=Clostridium cavendishii DSM 21758 TaxID=1121302 RepID=A0A1M6VGS5_9CLOT|nr:glycogen synthase GlgA [Clostridium cavendishii]SHK80561.1 starch synthase [Clostridium cavendishii DSM 21758]
MKVLFVTAEAHPFVKVGGLGEVAYSLPKALKSSEIDIRVILPKYKFPKKIRKKMMLLGRYKTYIGWKSVDCELWTLNNNGIQYYFIGNSFYFYRNDIYGYGDDDERFIYFCKAVLEGIKYMYDFTPDILHCNDWHSSMVSPLKKLYYVDNEIYANIKTLFTIHNIAYQGTFGKDTLWMLGLDEHDIQVKKLELNDGISFMKWAILESDKISTVSESYSYEIQEEGYGCGLNSIVKKRKKDLIGILNGIDYDIYNPEKDSNILYKYSKQNLDSKIKNKLYIQRDLKLEQDGSIPMITIISRLVDQKGLGLIEAAMKNIMSLQVQLIILGTGSSYFENKFKYLETKYKNKLRVITEFNDCKARQLYAGSDMFLMPSKFEPCGLGQLIALRYGTIPIVRQTGGLKDTVKDYNEYINSGNGFTFKEYSVNDMLESINRALNMYKNKDLWIQIMQLAMDCNNNWEKSSQKYKILYKNIIK